MSAYLRTHFEARGKDSFVAVPRKRLREFVLKWLRPGMHLPMRVGLFPRAFLTGILTLGFLAVPVSTAWASQSAPPRAGGSSDILVVQGRDARIILATDPQIGQILLDPIVFEVLWDGVVDGELQYLRIDRNRFFIAYSEADYAIFAYDCLGYQYLISPRGGSGGH